MGKFGTLSLGDSDTLVFRTDYDPGFVAAVKRIPTARYAGQSRTWSVKSSYAEPALALAEEFDIEVAKALVEKVEKEVAKREEKRQLSAAVDSPVISEIDIPGTSAELRPYQKIGVAYMAAQKATILADEMGTGKTLQSLSTVAATGKWPAMVVCPASLRINWRREVENFFPGKKAVVIGLGDGKKRDSEIAAAADADVVIVGYDILKKALPAIENAGILGRTQSLIADEAHYVKDLKSQRGTALLDMSRVVRGKDGLIILATGTPVINRPKDLIAPLRLGGKLDSEFGGWTSFVKRYCAGKETRYGWDIDGATNLPELEQKLRESCYIRRTKDQVLTELPEKQRSAVMVELSGQGQKEYVAGEKELANWVKEKGTSLADEAGGHDGAEILRHIGELRRAVGRAKVESAVEVASNIIDGGQKAIVFAIHRDVQGAIFDSLKENYKTAHITGDMGAEERQAEIDYFQSGKADVIVCSQKAAGVGLTLTAAQNVIFAEYDWTAASHDQAEDRAHRIGQKNAVNVWNIHAMNTIDDAMASIVEEKREIARQVTGDKDLGDGKKAPADIKRILSSVEDRQGSMAKPRKRRAKEAEVER